MIYYYFVYCSFIIKFVNYLTDLQTQRITTYYNFPMSLPTITSVAPTSETSTQALRVGKVKRCVEITNGGARCKRCVWTFGDSKKCKQHQLKEFKHSDKYSIINYRYTHPSKFAVGGLGTSFSSAIEL